MLPVVFYTGTRGWPSLGQLVDLVEMGERFAPVTPALELLYINLPATPPNRLVSAGGFFGWVLRLVQQRRAGPEEFQKLLCEAVDQLESMPAAERLRWLELLSYIHAVLYHERDESEVRALQEIVESSVQSKEPQGASGMRTMAQVLQEKGGKEGGLQARRNTLLRQLRQRFKEVPSQMEAVIEATLTVRQLDAWLDRFATAKTLEEMGIGTES